MAATAKIIKTSSLPIAGKFGVLVAGGVIAGAITAGTSATLSISKNGNTKISEDFPVKSINENIDYDNIMTLLNSQYILHIVIIYLLLMLVIFYLFDTISKKNYNLIL